MNKPLVLVVEDDRPVRNLIVTTLKAHDYRYLTAENGRGAIMEVTSLDCQTKCNTLIKIVNRRKKV